MWPKQDFADVVKLSILRWEIMLDDLGGPTYNHKYPSKREGEACKPCGHGGKD